MPNYQNGKIYKLLCTLKGIDEIYVGATVSELYQRLSEHRNSANKKNCKIYKFMREKGIKNFQMELLENVSCQSKKELDVREQHWIDTLKPSLNSYNSTPNPKAIWDRYNSKPSTKARRRAWAIANKDKIREQNQKLYYAKKNMNK